MSHIMGYIYSTCILSQPERAERPGEHEVVWQAHREAGQGRIDRSDTFDEDQPPLGVDSHPGSRLD